MNLLYPRDPEAVARQMRRFDEAGQEDRTHAMFDELIAEHGEELGAEIWSLALVAYDRLSAKAGESE